ncbi:hypothetical protein COO60DRAFT_1180617 [Scenedesmus sp. NREL 46B-D3]|nr:hypothetical protein COO60DRAFT_1180617 [Scenedesmus sp. NREL 46B-D3]
MALAHVAQRLGHAHVSRRGWFGSQQVWQLPDDLIPLALSLYQLQRSPLLDPAALEPDPSDLALQQQMGSSSSLNNSSSRSGAGSLMYGSWRLLVQQFIQTPPGAALRMVAPWLYVYDASSGQFEVLPPLNLALEPDALAVLDCGSELLIYVGEVLEGLVEGTAPAKEAAAGHENSSATAAAAAAGGGVEERKQQQQQQQQQGKEAGSAIESAADEAAVNGGSAAGRPLVPDMAVAAAPAVSCAHQLLRGRVPVPAVRLIEDEAGMAALMQRLVPLHEDPVALQLLLLPHLRDLSPAQHGYLLDWHKHWAAAGAAAAQQQGGVADGRVAGGARMVRGEGVSRQLSFGQWYSSFGMVLRSSSGILEGSTAVE